MGELTIRRNRGFAVPPYQGTARTFSSAADVSPMMASSSAAPPSSTPSSPSKNSGVSPARGFAVPPYQGTAKTEKKAAAGQAQSVSRTTGFAVSETLAAPPSSTPSSPSKNSGVSPAKAAPVMRSISPLSRTTGFAVSETLRQLMSRVSQAENQSRESRRTLQTGEAVLDEVQDRLGRLFSSIIGKVTEKIRRRRMQKARSWMLRAFYVQFYAVFSSAPAWAQCTASTCGRSITSISG